ncbi:hypothetical protein [Bifidobacterium canis]|nr:hypothetical protein [Bifidobacterium canis]
MHFEGGSIGKTANPLAGTAKVAGFVVLAAGFAVLTYFGRVG